MTNKLIMPDTNVLLFIITILLLFFFIRPNCIKNMFSREHMQDGNSYEEEYLTSSGSSYTTPYSGTHGYGQFFGNIFKKTTNPKKLTENEEIH